MSPRVFISYRSSDGADKATALARDLHQLFGDDQIFLDKDDLGGGTRWRDVIRQTLSAKPVLLVLVTPHYLEARDAEGRRRIEQPDDPVRNELAEAIAADAELIPVLCDGVQEVPNVATLPQPLNVYRGEGTQRFDPEQPGSLDVAMRIEAAESAEQIDSGALKARIGERGKRIFGKLRLNSEQADRAIDLRPDGSR